MLLRNPPIYDFLPEHTLAPGAENQKAMSATTSAAPPQLRLAKSQPAGQDS
jgi:hypothetical protein